MASTIILKNGTGSAIPSTLTHGEPAINVNTGLFYYGSGSAGIVKTLGNFTDITASLSASLGGNISASGYVLGKNIISTGNVSASGNIVATGFISSSGRIQTLSHITSSGQISASGTNLHTLGGPLTLGPSGDSIFKIMSNTENKVEHELHGRGNVHSFLCSSSIQNLGIGNPNPTEKLTVSGSISSSGNLILEGFISSSTWVNTGHVTASGNISASGGSHTLGGDTTLGRDLFVVNNISGSNIDASGNISAVGHITSSGRIQTLSHITASGNISSSGDISGSTIHSAGNTSATFFNARTGTTGYKLGGVKIIYKSGSGDIIFGQTNKKTIITGSSVVLGNHAAAHITASGNISSSNTITALSGSFSNLSVTGHITASMISASGELTIPKIMIKGGNTEATQRINFSSTNIDGDQYISGFNNQITINGDNYIKIEADNEIKINAPRLGIGTDYSQDNADEVPEALTVTGNISASGNIVAEGHITSSGRIQTLSHITASGNISSSGNVYSNNHEILAGSSFKVVDLDNGFYGLPGNNGWSNVTYGTHKSDGPDGLGNGQQHIGVIMPYKAILVGVIGVFRSGTTGDFKMSLWTEKVEDGEGSTNTDWTETILTDAVTVDATTRTFNFEKLDGTTAFVKGTSIIPGFYNDSGTDNVDIFGSWMIVVKRVV